MRVKFVCVILFILTACSKPPAEYPLAGAPVGKPMETARIKEGSLFFRGLDDRMLNSLELPNPYSDYVYVIYPGRHRLFGMNIQSGHILMPEDLRCYSMEVNLDAGVEYVIDEVKDKEEAILRRQDNGQVVARGKKYEQKDAYTGPCSMKK